MSLISLAFHVLRRASRCRSVSHTLSTRAVQMHLAWKAIMSLSSLVFEGAFCCEALELCTGSRVLLPFFLHASYSIRCAVQTQCKPRSVSEGWHLRGQTERR